MDITQIFVKYVMPALIVLGIAVHIFMITFVCYVAIMSANERKDAILAGHWSLRWTFLLVILPLGLVFDILLNWVVLTIAFLEIPQEFLATARIVRHKYHSTHWRQDQAHWWCKNWLTVFDPAHCDYKP